jgi:hypothetical protein
MQFIERNSFNVRAAVLFLKHPQASLEFVLFLMIHVGTRDYYRQVRQLLATCDYILFEGVRGLKVQIITFAYRFMVRRKRLGLVTQEELGLRELHSKLAHADVDAESFHASWLTLPFWLRIIFLGVVPFCALYQFLFATRQSIATGIEISELPTREEIFDSSEESEMIDEVLLHGRDAHLLENIENFFNKKRDQRLKVAVVYGAAHMRAVTRYLPNRLGYRVIRGEFVTVFEL